MKNSIYTALILSLVLFFSCKPNDDSTISEIPVSQNLISGQSQYDSVLTLIDANQSTPFSLDSFYVDEDYIYIVTHYSGGCENHEFTIVWDSNESSSIYNLTIGHNSNNDNCEALLSQTIKFEKEPFDVSAKVFEFIYGKGAKYTLSLGAQYPQTSSISIKTGYSFGECTNTCIFELQADANINRTLEANWQGDTTITSEQTTVTSDWTDLVNQFDEDLFFNLDDTYGCPDCADGGSEWIEITTNSQTHKVTFEYGDTLSDIAAFHASLKSFGENLGFQ